MPKLPLRKSLLLTKLSQTARLFSDNTCFRVISKISPWENKLQQANTFPHEASPTFSSHMRPHHSDISFLCCLCHRYPRVKALHWRNLENLSLSHAVNRLHPYPWCTLCVGTLLLGASLWHLLSTSRGQVHLVRSWASRFFSLLLLHPLGCCSPDPIDQLHLFQDAHQALAQAEALALWQFLAGSSLHKAH